MKILVIGHSYVVDSNRQFWNQVAVENSVEIDLICPLHWKSNLIKVLDFKYNSQTDFKINKIYPIKTYISGNGSFYHYHWIEFFKVLFFKKYDSIFIFQESWAISLAQLILIKLFGPNRSSKIHLAVCQNIIKPKLRFLIPFERLLTFFVERIWYCTEEINKVLDYKKIRSKRSYLPFTFDHAIYFPKIVKLNNQINLGFIGRLTEEKGILDLIQAVEELTLSGHNMYLHIAGAGKLESRLDKSFIKYYGVIPHSEAHHFYQKIDILVLPSRTTPFWKEQFGRVLVEAAASGKVVLGSSSGAIPEVIHKIGLGEVFKEGDVADLKQKILSLVGVIQSPNFDDKMNDAIERTIAFSSHVSVGKHLVEVMKDDN